jgi:hypothetical protein
MQGSCANVPETSARVGLEIETWPKREEEPVRERREEIVLAEM